MSAFEPFGGAPCVAAQLAHRHGVGHVMDDAGEVLTRRPSILNPKG